MALSLPFDITLDGGVNASHVQSNFQTIANKFGTLVAADMPGLTLPTTQLSASAVEELLGGTFNLSAALTTGNKFAVNIQGAGTYTVVGGRCSYTLTGGTSGAGNTFQILCGNYNGTGFTTTSTIVNSTSFYTGAADVANSKDLTITTGSFVAPCTILFTVNAISGTPPTGGMISATLRVTRSLQ